MQAFSGITICRMGFFFGMETSKVNNFFVMFDACLPAAVTFFHPRKAANSFKAMFVRSLAVCSVLPICSFSQIFKSVVCAVAVDMVNLFKRHRACYVKPNKSMGSIVLPIDFKVNISTMMKAPSFTSNANFWSRAIPIQEPCGRIIAKKFGKFIMCNHAENLPGFGKDCKD